MIKKLLSLLLLVFASPILAGPNVGYYDQPHYGYHDPIDYGALKRIIEQELDHYFQPYSLPSSIKPSYNRLKKQAMHEIPATISHLCSDQTTAKSMVKNLAQDYAVGFIVTIAQEMADIKFACLLYTAPVNPYYVERDKATIIAIVVDIIRSQAYIELSANKGKLDRLVKNLSNNIETLLRQEFERYY